MKKIHIDFVIMTIKSEKMRVIIGNRKKFSPIVYTMDMNDGEFGENYYSYCAYLIVNAINKLRLLLADMHGDDVVIGCARQYK